jgi:hypothetical protein
LFVTGVFNPKASSVVSADGDLALHILLGDLAWESGWVLPTEPTTYTADQKPFIAHEWLAEVVLSRAHSLAGLAGPVLLVSALFATVGLVLMRRMRELGVSPWPQVIVAAFAVCVAGLHLLVRPHVTSWLFALLWYMGLERLRLGEISWRRWLLCAAPLVVLWTNLHGGFLMAFVLMGIYGLATLFDAAVGEASERPKAWRRLRELVLLGGVILLLSGVNPWGFRLHLHILSFMGESTILGAIAEFASPDFHALHGRLFMVAALGLIALLVLGRERPATIDWLLPMALLAQSLVSIRNAAFFAILSAPVAARRLEGLLRELAGGDSPAGAAARGVLASSDRLLASDRRAGGAVTLALLAVVVGAVVGVRGPEMIDFDPEGQPVEALAYVEAHPDQLGGPMFNEYSWGGFIAYRGYPRHKTFINGFNDNYGPELLESYVQVVRLKEGWREVLDRHGVEWVLFGTDEPLTRVLREDPAWEAVYSDELATILLRRG